MSLKLKDIVGNIFYTDKKEKEAQAKKSAALQQTANNVFGTTTVNPFLNKNGELFNPLLNYNKIYVDTTGTAQVRKSTAEMQLSDYEIASIIYERAYETIDHKISYAKELLQSAKRVLSRRIASIEISKLSER